MAGQLTLFEETVAPVVEHPRVGGREQLPDYCSVCAHLITAEFGVLACLNGHPVARPEVDSC